MGKIEAGEHETGINGKRMAQQGLGMIEGARTT
jgi:hypothetical protein